MFPQLYLKTCVQTWSFLAQAMPASPAVVDAPAAASGIPVTVASSAPAGAPALPAAAASAVPVTVPAVPVTVASGVPQGGLPVTATMTPQLDMNLPQAAHGPAYGIMHGVLLAVYFVLCIALIVCVMFQTTKNEGLSGVIGGTPSSSLFRGKKSAEETLGLWTSRLAVSFIVLSLVIWFFFARGV